MKKLFALLAVLALAAALTACGPAPEPAEPPEPVPEHAPVQESVPEPEPSPAAEFAPYSVDGPVFTYDGTAYDLQEISPLIDTTLSCRTAGNYIVLEGHVNPRNSVYCIFDTDTRAFVRDIAGANLTWYDDDITTAVYNFWSEIYDYDDNLIATADTGENGFIRSLTFSEDRTALEVTVENGTGTEVQTIPLTES